MKIVYKFIVFLCLILSIIVPMNYSMEWISFRWQNLNSVYKSYTEHYTAENSLCVIPKADKITICNAILNYQSFQEMYHIYLNKNAIVNNSLKCESKNLRVHYKRKLVKQCMFPCHGRHNPLQINWQQDDFYKYVYISEGPTKNSIFVYVQSLTTNREEYIIHSLITEVNVKELPEVIIAETDLEDELKSTRLLSLDYRQGQIEALYIRYVVKQKMFKLNSSVCDLNKQIKFKICQKIFETEFFRQNYSLEESSFNDYTAECIDVQVSFLYENWYNKKNITQKMYSCYEKEKNPAKYGKQPHFMISDSFRENSVIIFHKNSEAETCTAYMIVDNLNINPQSSNDTSALENNNKKYVNSVQQSDIPYYKTEPASSYCARFDISDDSNTTDTNNTRTISTTLSKPLDLLEDEEIAKILILFQNQNTSESLRKRKSSQDDDDSPVLNNATDNDNTSGSNNKLMKIS